MPRSRRRDSGWPAPRAGTGTLTCPAPSSTPGHAFTLDLAIAWEELPSPRPHHSPDAVAADHALTAARGIAAAFPATDALPAAARINAILGRPHELLHLPIRLIWAQAHLTASPEALQAAQRHERHEGEREQNRAEQSQRMDDARILRDTLMSDPSMALAYWFATAPHTVDANTLNRLQDLFESAAAYAPQGRWAPLARALHAFADKLDEDGKIHLLDTLAGLTDRYGHPDIASTILSLRQMPSKDTRSP
ncbi:hypothetical protein [Streptomyces sp. NPDC005548]|uniref:hypothetical protein n=1 Tax=Streptomyces sp. NPDC005548 TaxID=3364724 RepID=UPI003679CE38